MKSPRLAAIRFAKYGLSRWLVGSIVVCIAIGAFSTHFWTPGGAQPAEAPDSEPMESNEPIQPILVRTDLDPRKIALGRKLFADPAARSVFGPSGAPLTEGQGMAQPDLAATLAQLRAAGVGDFYQGVLAHN